MRLRFCITIGIIFISLGVLAFGLKEGAESSSIVVVDMGQVAKSPKNFQGREIRIRGFVKTGSILRQHGDRADFIMEQAGHKLAVSYLGKTQLPDTFTDGAPIRADGRITPQNTFVATRLEAKCASKYKAPHAK